MADQGNTNWGGKLNTIDHPSKASCFDTKVNNIFHIKWVDLNELAQGGQMYCAFPFSKHSLAYLFFASAGP